MFRARRRPRSHPTAQECQAVEDPHRRHGRTKRGAEGIQIARLGALATVERIPPAKPLRDKDALLETAGPTPEL